MSDYSWEIIESVFEVRFHKAEHVKERVLYTFFRPTNLPSQEGFRPLSKPPANLWQEA